MLIQLIQLQLVLVVRAAQLKDKVPMVLILFSQLLLPLRAEEVQGEQLPMLKLEAQAAVVLKVEVGQSELPIKAMPGELVILDLSVLVAAAVQGARDLLVERPQETEQIDSEMEVPV